MVIVFVETYGRGSCKSCSDRHHSINTSLLFRGERASAISCTCMSINGVKVYKDTSNSDTFYDIVQTHLIPHLMPFNGTHSAVDNCSIHHCAEVASEVLEYWYIFYHHISLTLIQ